MFISSQHSDKRISNYIVVGLFPLVTCLWQKTHQLVNSPLLYELFTQKYSSCAQVVYISTFLPEGIILGFWNFEWGFNSQENKIWVELKNLGLKNTLGDYVQLRHFYWSKMDLIQSSVMFYHKKMNPILSFWFWTKNKMVKHD